MRRGPFVERGRERLMKYGIKWLHALKDHRSVLHLIALSARRIGAVVITSNRADFERIRACYGFELYFWE